MRSPAIAPGIGFTNRPSLGHGLGWQVEAVQIFIQSDVRGEFGHQQEISAALNECLTQRLPGVEVVTSSFFAKYGLPNLNLTYDSSKEPATKDYLDGLRKNMEDRNQQGAENESKN